MMLSEMQLYSNQTKNEQCDIVPVESRIITMPLFRFVRLCDRVDSQVFTFIVLPQLVRGLIDKISSLPFVYCHHLWRVNIERNEPHIGVFLECLSIPNANSSEPVDKLAPHENVVSLDVCFSFQNREHFTRNENVEMRNQAFHKDQKQTGRSTFIELSQLSSRRFLFDDGRCLIDVTLSQLTTKIVIDAYPCQDPSMKGPFGYKKNTNQMTQVTALNGTQLQIPLHTYLETSVFSYAGFQWKFAVNMDVVDTSKAHDIQPKINSELSAVKVPQSHKSPRNENLNSWCKLSCSADLPGRFNTGDMEFFVGPQGWPMKAHRITLHAQNNATSTVAFAQACVNGPLKLSLKLNRAIPVSVLEVVPTLPNAPNRECSYVMDPEGYEWLMHAESGGRLLRLGLLPIKPNMKRQPTQPLIPPGYCRVVGWNVQLIPARQNKPSIRPVTSNNGQTVIVNQEYSLNHELSMRIAERPGVQTPYKYDEEEELITLGEVAMNIPMNEVCDLRAGISNSETGAMTVHIEWLLAHLMMHNRYHVFDDITKLHMCQMRMELAKVQHENQRLEKQLITFQIETTGPNLPLNSRFDNSIPQFQSKGFLSDPRSQNRRPNGEVQSLSFSKIDSRQVPISRSSVPASPAFSHHETSAQYCRADSKLSMQRDVKQRISSVDHRRRTAYESNSQNDSRERENRFSHESSLEGRYEGSPYSRVNKDYLNGPITDHSSYAPNTLSPNPSISHISVARGHFWSDDHDLGIPQKQRQTQDQMSKEQQRGYPHVQVSRNQGEINWR